MCTRYGKSWCPQHCRCPEACGGLTVWEFDGVHNTVGKMSAPTTLFMSERLWSTVPVGVQGMVPGTVV